MKKVYINKTAGFLPNQGVANNDIENRLGMINGNPSRAKNIVLRNNKISNRYYAINGSGKASHSNADLTAQAVKNLLSSEELQKIELLSCGTGTPDQLLPSHAAMVHGALKNKTLEIHSPSGACCAGMSALKYAYMAVKSDDVNYAVCTGSELSSSRLKAQMFLNEMEKLGQLESNPILAFNKDFLRWMLSDGAGAFLMSSSPEGANPLLVEWVEFMSFAHQIPACMYSGAEKLANGDLTSWTDISSEEWVNNSVFALKQDIKLLDKNIIEKGVESLKHALAKNKISSSDIDFYLPHISSYYFKDKLYKAMQDAQVEIPEEKWYLNLESIGNIGAASIYLALDSLVKSNTLKKGQKILLSVPESARFSYSYALLTVV